LEEQITNFLLQLYLFKMPFKLDPEVGAALQKLMPNGPPPKPEVGDYQTRRANVAGLFKILMPPVAEDVQIKDYETTGIDGNKILLRWYEKKGTAKGGPAILYMHGGGYIAGTVDMTNGGVAAYVSNTGVPFLSVEYRLAPEAQYPGNVADAHAGLLWLHEHASELGIDVERIAVMGESAGGGLAAALTHYNIEKKGPAIAKQILVYPMLDDRNLGEHPHIGQFAIWTVEDNKTAWPALLGKRCGAPDLPPSAAPARMKTAEGLPPLFIDIGELDIFRDENIEYAAKFGKAGISAEIHIRPGVPHAFEGLAPQGVQAQATFADRFRAIQTIEKVEGGAKL
jgi:acetyl esterase/lipase